MSKCLLVTFNHWNFYLMLFRIVRGCEHTIWCIISFELAFCYKGNEVIDQYTQLVFNSLTNLMELALVLKVAHPINTINSRGATIPLIAFLNFRDKGAKPRKVNQNLRWWPERAPRQQITKHLVQWFVYIYYIALVSVIICSLSL